jgi:hypothetical protein
MSQDEPIKWSRSTQWSNADVCVLVGRKPSAITETEKKFIKKLFWSCRKDPRYAELDNIQILAQIQTHLEVRDELMVGAIKTYNIPVQNI